MLWQFGFDVEQPYSFEECWHRPLTAKTNEPVFAIRVVGAERLCPEWIQSGNASAEAIIESERDPELRAILKCMSTQAQIDRTWMDENIAKAVIKREKKGI